jgi:hypothetical protein
VESGKTKKGQSGKLHRHPNSSMSLSLKVVDMEVCTQLVEPKKATGGQMLSGLPAWCRHRPGKSMGIEGYFSRKPWFV